VLLKGGRWKVWFSGKDQAPQGDLGMPFTTRHSAPPGAVRRVVWSYRPTGGTLWQPVECDQDVLLEQAASRHVPPGRAAARIPGEAVRGWRGPRDATDSAARALYDQRTPTTLYLLLHGTGQRYFNNHDKLAKKMRKMSSLLDPPGTRSEWLPITWTHNSLIDDARAMVALVSHPTSGKFTAQTAFNEFSGNVVLFAEQRGALMAQVSQRVREVIAAWYDHHPASRSVPVVVAGHSLGGVLAYDMVADKTINLGAVPRAVVVFGSPLGLYMAMRKTKGRLPRGVRLFNLFIADDMFAYRVQAVLGPSLRARERSGLELVPPGQVPVSAGSWWQPEGDTNLASEATLRAQAVAQKTKTPILDWEMTRSNIMVGALPHVQYFREDFVGFLIRVVGHIWAPRA